jgi:hypothetical protein
MEMAKSFADKAQTAARLNTWRGFVTQYAEDFAISIQRISNSGHPRFDAPRAALIIAGYPFEH